MNEINICKLFYDISIGLVSGIVIWVAVEYLPRKKNKSNTSFQVVKSSEKVLGCLMGIMEACLNSKEIQPIIWAQREINFPYLLSSVEMNDELKAFRSGSDGHNMTVGSSVTDFNVTLKKEVSNLLRFTYHLDTELLKLVSEIESNTFFEKWENIYNSIGKPVHLPQPYGTVVPPIPKLSSNFTSNLEEMYDSYKKLEKYLLDTFPQDPVVLKRKEAKAANVSRGLSTVEMIS